MRRTVLAALVTLALSACADNGTTRQYLAYDACTSFVKDALKSPATAEFPDFQDGGVTVIGAEKDGPFIVVSTVDSENGFGALVRNDFTCTVTRVAPGDWRLDDLQLGGG